MLCNYVSALAKKTHEYMWQTLTEKKVKRQTVK